MQKARRQPSYLKGNIGLRPFVSCWFQVYFTPLTGVLFTFPSRYLFTIGHQWVFSLGGWSPQIQTGFHVSGPTQVPARLFSLFVYGTLTLCRWTFHSILLSLVSLLTQALQPRKYYSRFGLFPFRSPLLRESLIDFFSSAYWDVSLQRVLPSHPMYSDENDKIWLLPGSPIRIPPDLRFDQLPGAFRRYSRPSSPFDAKASVSSP